MKRYFAGLAFVALNFPTSAFAAESPSANVQAFFQMIADPSSTVETLKAFQAKTPVASDAIFEAETPSMLAIHKRRADLFQYLDALAGHPNLNKIAPGTFLSLYEEALFYADMTFIQELKKRGGFIKDRQEEFTRVCLTNTLDVVQAFVKAGARVNASDAMGDYPLIEATMLNRIEVIQYLVSVGANVNVADRDGNTPMLGLGERPTPGAEVIFDFLLKNGANPHAKNKNGDSLIALASSKSSTGFVKKLVEFGLDVNGLDKETNSPLIIAIVALRLDTVQLLLKAGAQPNLATNEKRTALMIAVNQGTPEIMQALLAAGADVNLQMNSGYTALHWAAWDSSTIRIQQLLNAGAAVNLQNTEGRTALFNAVASASSPLSSGAIHQGNLKVIQLLVEAGTNLSLTDQDGADIYAYAVSNHAPDDVLSLLVN